MNDKILASLIQILQKHADSIRKLRLLNTAMFDCLEKSEERAGVPFEEFRKQFAESLASAHGGSQFDPQGVAKELEETIDLMNTLETLRKETPN